MSLKINKSKLAALPVLALYILIIISDIVNTSLSKYTVIIMVILYSVYCIYVSAKRKGSSFISDYFYILIYLFIIESMTLINGFNRGLYTIIGEMLAPLFIVASLIIGYELQDVCRNGGMTLFFKGVILIITVAALEGVYEYIFKQNLFIPDYNIAVSGRVASFFNHPIKYATSMIVGIFLAFYLISKKNTKLIIIGLCIFGLFTSMSRSGWIACAISVVLLINASFRRKVSVRTLKIIGIIFVFIFVFFKSSIGANLIEIVSTRLSLVGDDTSTIQRLGSIQYILENLGTERNPLTLFLGHGEGASGILMKNTVISWKNFGMTDNEYLLILYDYGLIALSAVIAFFIKTSFSFLINYQQKSNIEKALMCIIISQCINAFFYEITNYRNCAYVVLICFGFFMRNNKDRVDNSSLAYGQNE